MFFLIAPLCVTVDYENKKSNKHLISLRDYDFVGEDQRLSALLAERMAVLQAPLNLSEPEARGPAPEPAEAWRRYPDPFQPKPDYLHSNVRLPQVVNVSMDYAELINASLLALAPGPGAAPAPRLGGAPAPGNGRSSTLGYRRAQTPGIGRQSLGTTTMSLKQQNQKFAMNKMKSLIWVPYRDPSFRNYNEKILDLMKQSIYATQRRMIELDPFIRKYDRDPRFRMAFIYKRLQEWLHDMRTALYYLTQDRYWPVRVKRVIWYYENLLRLNIDITYSIDHLLHLHAEYTRNLDKIVPPKQREMLNEMKKQQRKYKKMQELGLTTGKSFPGFPGPGR